MKEIGIIITAIILFTGTTFGQDNFAAKRERMIETQLKARGISDLPTLAAMRVVPRHKFVPKNTRLHAYEDGALPIGKGQTISQPYIVAFMTEALKLKKTDRVLEIGTGSGYQAAVLGKIVDSVYTIEIVEDLALEAQNRLKELNYNNIIVKAGDGYHGWPEHAPFDAIMVTAGAEQIPEALVEQLKEGARLIIPVGPHHGVRQLVLVTKKKNKVVQKNLLSVRFVPFTREE